MSPHAQIAAVRRNLIKSVERAGKKTVVLNSQGAGWAKTKTQLSS